MSDSAKVSVSKAKVDIIMVAREQFSCTQESLRSLYENTDTPFDLIVVDNNSPDDVAQFLRQQAEARNFRLVRVDRYVTPNQSRNIGLRYATKDYIAFVDNDVAYTPGWLTSLLETAEATGAALVGPLMCQFEPLHEVIHCAGGEIMEAEELKRFLQEDRSNDTLEKSKTSLFRIDEKIFKQGLAVADENNKAPVETGFIEFHCCLVRRDVFDRLGELDEQMMSTKEHIDFSLQLLRSGSTIYLDPRAVVTYFAFDANRPLRLNEVPFYMLRWSDTWHVSSLERLKNKWHLDNDRYFREKLGISSWRRKKAAIQVIQQMIPFGNRIPGRLYNMAWSFLQSLEKAINRAYVKRYSGKMPVPVPRLIH